MIRAIDRQLRKLRVTRRLMLEYARADGVSTGRQLGEILYLWARNRIGPLEYYHLGLHRPGVPWREKLNTVSGAWYWEKVERINPSSLRVFATNKIASSLLLSSYGIPTPKIHGVLDRARGQTFEGAPLRDGADLEELVRSRTLSGICFKPISAWSGRGFVKVAFVREAGAIRAMVQPSGPSLALDELCSEYLGKTPDGSYLLQDIVEQHPEVARFHAPSLNTIRTWMYQVEPGRWKMFCANIRMGVGGKTVDNTAMGGIGTMIDIETGKLGKAVLRRQESDGETRVWEYAVHPSSGVRIEGETLPMWKEIHELCARTGSLFPFYGFMGVDVGIGREHPWVIEVEADPHSVVQLYCACGLRPMMEPLLKRNR